jgi:hypothetical protein
MGRSGSGCEGLGLKVVEALVSVDVLVLESRFMVPVAAYVFTGRAGEGSGALGGIRG